MPTPGMAPHQRAARVTPLYAAALIVTAVSGLCALFALAAGSPLQFGVALAMLGGGWIAADFLDRTVERTHERAAPHTGVKAPPPLAGSCPCRVVYVGRREQVSLAPPRATTRVAA
ncbi:hypothetical protein [Mycobacterium sp.]|uniref:hypothetical protein n=1 Tax=Mycobacterium sp. TaxID=1785 RepID=UPI001208526D|nr:hypothetical protein [Mycobacterium sp.]TAM72154.1 MAG: hypothetical protein EPN51_03770 [Mycobacterium sp.]